MLRIRTCINVCSEMNPWIDFCIVFETYTEKIGEIVQKAYDDWWELSGTQEPIADWISRCLTENDIKHEIYC